MHTPYPDTHHFSGANCEDDGEVSHLWCGRGLETEMDGWHFQPCDSDSQWTAQHVSDRINTALNETSEVTRIALAELTCKTILHLTTISVKAKTASVLPLIKAISWMGAYTLVDVNFEHLWCHVVLYLSCTEWRWNPAIARQQSFQ